MISVVYCTRETKPSHTEHIKTTSGLNRYIQVIEIINNGESLTKCYNRGLKMATNDIVVFMHDDIEIETASWGNKIIKHFESNPEHGILGLAGTTDMPLSGRWWEDRSKMVGIVNHKNEGKKWESKYSVSLGNELADVLIVDGLFFAVHKQRIKETFDESVNGFHFYEITFGFSNHLKGVKIGVMFNIRVTHLSMGMTNDEWEKNRLEFVKKFNDELPEKLVPDFYNIKSEKNFNGKIKIRVIIPSAGDIEVFDKLHKKIMSFNYPNLSIALITSEDSYEKFMGLDYNNTQVFQGFYNKLPQNLSILKSAYENNFISNDDDLVFLMNDNIEIINNIFVNFAKIYSANKNNFGCGFPLSYHKNKTIFCSSLEIFANKEGKVAINMRDNGTYYNVSYGQITNNFGNLSDCLVTTPTNLKIVDWLQLNYETPIYFNDFSVRLSKKNKMTYNDTNSLTVQTSFEGQSNIQQDFQSFINLISLDEKLKKSVKQFQ